MHLSNTASMALMGTMAGPWGAAIGGAVGLTMDLAGANDDLQAAIKAADDAASTQAINLINQRSTLDALRATQEEYAGSVERAGSIGSKSYGDMFTKLSDIFTNTREESAKAVSQANQDFLSLRQGLGTVFADLNNGDMSLLQGTDEELTAFANQIAPAATRAGPGK